jgi:hypothetical protein
MPETRRRETSPEDFPTLAITKGLVPKQAHELSRDLILAIQKTAAEFRTAEDSEKSDASFRRAYDVLQKLPNIEFDTLTAIDCGVSERDFAIFKKLLLRRLEHGSISALGAVESLDE